MRVFLIAMALILSLTTMGFADGVLFKNGDRLTGKIVSMSGGKLVIETPNAGKVTVDLANVKTFRTDGPIEIHFKDGTVMKRQVGAGDSGSVRIGQGGVVQPQAFTFDSMDAINPAKLEVKWEGSISAGAKITRGNTKSQSASVDLNAVRKSELDRLSFDAGYRGSRQEDLTTGKETTSERTVFGGLQYDYFFNDDWYGYANTKAEKNAPALLDLRLIAGAGLGYQAISNDKANLSFEAGASWFSENFTGTTPDDDFIAARAAMHADYIFDSGVKFFHDSEWFPNTEDFDDQLISTSQGLRATLIDNFFAEFKVEFDWDTTPATGKDRRDVTYILGVGWTF